MTDHAGLIERLSKATGPDRELDRDIWWALERPAALRSYYNAAMGKPKDPGEVLPPGLGRLGVESDSPKFTASLDAAIALVERKKPGEAWAILYAAMMNWRAHTKDNLSDLPRLVCLALLRSLNKDGTNG